MCVLDRIQQLLVDGGNLVEIGQAAAQVARQCTSLDERHDQVQDALLIAVFDQRQDVRVM